MSRAPWEYLRAYTEKPARTVVGLMSGTSVDGVDVAVVTVSGTGRSTRVALGGFYIHPYPTDLRAMVLALSHGEGNAEIVSRANMVVGRLFADATRAALERLSPDERQMDLIASHGQTVSHTPVRTEKASGATLQIGEPSFLAQSFGVPVVSDFRVADVALGGQGAPLVPYADWCLFTHPTKTRAIQNIGGIGNVTYLPADASPAAVIGFDTGPGNMLMDRAVQYLTGGRETFDPDGHFAVQGRVRADVLHRLLSHPFLPLPPPKSAGREEFGAAFFEQLRQEQDSTNPWLTPARLPDALATLCAFTAVSIADAYRRFLPVLPDEIIVGGGGARNPALLTMLQQQLPHTTVIPHEAVGIDSDAKEAIAFAVLANETMLGNPSNLPSVTGASRSTLLGKITLPG